MLHVQRSFDARPQPHPFDFFVRVLVLFQFGGEDDLGNFAESTMVKVVDHLVDAVDFFSKAYCTRARDGEKKVVDHGVAVAVAV